MPQKPAEKNRKYYRGGKEKRRATFFSLHSFAKFSERHHRINSCVYLHVVPEYSTNKKEERTKKCLRFGSLEDQPYQPLFLSKMAAFILYRSPKRTYTRLTVSFLTVRTQKIIVWNVLARLLAVSARLSFRIHSDQFFRIFSRQVENINQRNGSWTLNYLISE